MLDNILREYGVVRGQYNVTDLQTLSKNSEYSHCFDIKMKVILDDNIKTFAVYSIRVCIPKNYPSVCPEVLDLNSQIPLHKDYHIDPDSKLLCLEHPITIYQKWIPRDLYTFIEQFVGPFYYNFLYRQTYGQYPSGEYSHEGLGHVEALMEYFKLSPQEKHLVLGRFLQSKELKKILPKSEYKYIKNSLLSYQCPQRRVF